MLPNCLQIGWCESPPHFGAVSDTAIHVIDRLLHEVNLPEHSFEEHMISYQTDNPRHRLRAAVT